MIRLDPYPGKCAIVLDPPDEKTAGGIILPENARDNCTIGTIIALRETGWYEHSTYMLPLVHVNDRVAIGRYAGVKLLIEGREVLILDQSAILAVLIDEAVYADHP